MRIDITPLPPFAYCHDAMIFYDAMMPRHSAALPLFDAAMRHAFRHDDATLFDAAAAAPVIAAMLIHYLLPPPLRRRYYAIVSL